VKPRHCHDWDVTPAEARAIQERLRQRVVLEDAFGKIQRAAGADVAFDALSRRAIAGVVLYEVLRRQDGPWGVGEFELREIERVWATVPLRFPYVPGLLSFREAPALLAAMEKLHRTPDVIFCDAQGYAHPRRFGLACHLGVLLDCATVGCAKSRLLGRHAAVAARAGSWTPLLDGDEVIGAVVRTRTDVQPIYVSSGHRVSLPTAIALTLAVCDGFRIPRPTRAADQFVRKLKSESPRT
jgi:deoxyribonuclease V